MGQGYLTIELFVGDHVLPVQNATVLVKDHSGNILHRLITDEHGHTETIPLEAPSTETEPFFAAYDVEVPEHMGLRHTLIHGTQVFDTVTSILPIHMEPVTGDTPAEDTNEAYIPREHGVDIDRGEPLSEEERERRTEAAYANPAPNPQPSNPQLPNPQPSNPSTVPRAVILANEVTIPEYIVVHLGSPNADARNVRVPFKDYVKLIGG